MNDLLSIVEKQLSNEFLSGGLILGVLVAIATSLRRIPGLLWLWFKSRLIVTVDVSDHDQAFFWIQTWLGQQSYTKNKARLLTLTTKTAPVGYDAPKSIDSSRRRPGIEFIFSPAPGYHLFRYKGHFILLQRIRIEAKTTSSYTSYHETFVIQSFSKAIIEELVLEAKSVAAPEDDARVAIYRVGYQGWRLTQMREPRSLKSVILDRGILEDLLADLTWFMGAHDWYVEHGIPYQRGYTIVGPPGNGKTSLVLALASTLKRDIYILSLAGMTDSSLSYQMAELPEHSFLLIEDVDSAFVGRERSGDTNDRLTFSGMLNAIDGVSAPTGRILFMTTNHPEKLDPALVRPGRADKQVELANATPGMAYRLFLHFFPDSDGYLAEKFADALGARLEKRSMASLQELLIKHLKSPEDAIEELKDGHATGQATSHIRVERLD